MCRQRANSVLSQLQAVVRTVHTHVQGSASPLLLHARGCMSNVLHKLS